MSEPKKRGRPKGLTEQMQADIRKEMLARRAEMGVESGPGNKTLKPMRQEEVRAQIQATKIVQRLQQHGDGTLDLSPTQIKAYEILLSKSLATLQATEITEVSKNDKLTEAEILAKIAEIVKREPRLADMVHVHQVVDVPLVPSAPFVPGEVPASSEGDSPNAEDTAEDATDDTCSACGSAVQWGVCAGCGRVVGA